LQFRYLRHETGPGDPALAGVVLPEAGQAAAVDDRVIGEVLDTAQGEGAALAMHGAAAVFPGKQGGDVAAQVGDAVDAGDEGGAGRWGRAVAAERLPVLGKEQEVGTGFQRDEAERRRRFFRPPGAQAREPLEVRQRGGPDPAEVAGGERGERFLAALRPAF